METLGFSHHHFPPAARFGWMRLALTVLLAAVATGFSQAATPAQAAAFEAFTPRVKWRWDEKFLYIENNGLPAHGMMVGITAWQQQVPMPQSYIGENAWRVPLTPVPAKQPLSIKGRFLRGAIAIAANGIPIFNPQNNRGEISQEIGELDQWGGHCGRADDYHYHVAPLHLQSTVGEGKPIAYALDGYPIYGLTDPGGASPGKLDECNGHTIDQLGYHYHASATYPYVNGGFHGEVTERDGQVDPQPRARSLRQDQPPLPGAKITGFKAAADEKSFVLQYALNGKSATINYSTVGDGAWKFQSTSVDGRLSEEIYPLENHRGDPPPSPRNDRPPGPDHRLPPPQTPRAKPVGSFVLNSSEVMDGGNLPIDYTGDGSGSTLPLTWSGAPAGTKCYALIMHHLDPEGVVKWYWTLYDIPAEVTSLPKNSSGIGKLGTGFKGRIGYEAPHSKGPGPKRYTLTLYALSSPAKINLSPLQVNRQTLLAAIHGSILATTELNVIYSNKDPAPPAR
jgi:phosphatidylethanolamine-binding protein (PEBP) family uncharacterized protein